MKSLDTLPPSRLFTVNSPELPKKSKIPTWTYCIHAMSIEDSSIGDITVNRTFKYRVPKGMQWDEAVNECRETLESLYPFRNYVLLTRYDARADS